MNNLEIKKSVVSEINNKVNDFKVLIAPIITEKSTFLKKNENKIIFKVQKNANKINVKKAFEKIFKVKVLKISISNVHPTVCNKRYKGKYAGYKKAFIKLKKGDVVDFFKK